MESLVLQKYIAASGYCSRRKAEDLIKQEKVKVNGKLAELGMRVNIGDVVKIGSKTINAQTEKIYIALNKPVGYTCTNRHFPGEKSVFDLIPKELNKGLHVAGRLDKDSCGLIILTNDGDLTEKLTHPRNEHEKEYLVKVVGKAISPDVVIKTLEKGVDIGEGDGKVKAKCVKHLPNGNYVIILTEGKKRQIRRMFKQIGLTVVFLERQRMGKIRLGDIKSRTWKLIQRISV